MNLRWFTSKTVREAVDMRGQVRRLYNEQRDLLTPQACDGLLKGIAQMGAAIRSNATDKVLREEMKTLEKTATAWLKPYPAAAIRENVKEFLVAITTIMAFTTFFLQLTKIPTGSMQPTLYGITVEDLRGKTDVTIPPFYRRVWDYWVYGYSYFHVVARAEGELTRVEPVQTILPFVKKQRFFVGNEPYTVWFPPDELFGGPHNYSGLNGSEHFKVGDDILKLRMRSGDHLLVDRFTYNFRLPKRGEIIVFKTKGINGLVQDQLYIKRLVGLGGEKLQIGDDRHLVVNGKRLDASTRHFESVYSFDGPPRESQYSGHVNGTIASKYGHPGLAPNFFQNAEMVYEIPPHRYIAMGDNTMNSLDARSWGDLPQSNVIGKCFFVYWPLSPRFGWGYR